MRVRVEKKIGTAEKERRSPSLSIDLMAILSILFLDAKFQAFLKFENGTNR